MANGERDEPAAREGGVDSKARSGGQGEGVESAERAREKRPALDARGMERPAFLLDYPEDPDLEKLVRAFEVGNYAFVRAEADRVANAARDPAVRQAALELRERIEPDPLARYLLAIAVVLLVFLTVWAYSRAE
jgi:hypothetical protein